MSYDQHISSARAIVARCAVITLSDTRTVETDKSGARIREMLTAAGHAVADHRLIRDEPAELMTCVNEFGAREDIDIILTNGGTGISPRDQTIEALQESFDRQIPGFGELFRMLSWEQIRSGAMLSRATAGTIGNKAIFAMPGSTRAVELAMEKLILPQLQHLISELRK